MEAPVEVQFGDGLVRLASLELPQHFHYPLMYRALVMSQKRYERQGIAWLELLLMLAFIALLVQVFPSLWLGFLWAVDVRNWSRGVWLGINVGVVIALFGLRFAPGLYEEWREHRARLAAEREKQEKQRQLREQHELFERLQRARERRIY